MSEIENPHAIVYDPDQQGKRHQFVAFPGLERLAQQINDNFPDNPQATWVLEHAHLLVQAGYNQQLKTLEDLRSETHFRIGNVAYLRADGERQPLYVESPARKGAPWAQTNPVSFIELTHAFNDAALVSRMPIEIDPETGLARQMLVNTGVRGPGVFGLMHAPNFSCEFMIPMTLVDEDGRRQIGLRAIRPYGANHIQMPGGMEQYTLSGKGTVTFDPLGRAKEFFEEMLSGSLEFTLEQEENLEKDFNSALVSDPDCNSDKLKRRLRAEHAIRIVQERDENFFIDLQRAITQGGTVSHGVYIHPGMTDTSWGESAILNVDCDAIESLLKQKQHLGLAWSAGDDAGEVVVVPIMPEHLKGWHIATFSWAAAFALMDDFIKQDGKIDTAVSQQFVELVQCVVGQKLIPNKSRPGYAPDSPGVAVLA